MQDNLPTRGNRIIDIARDVFLILLCGALLMGAGAVLAAFIR